MTTGRKKYILFGVENYKKLIDRIIEEHQIEKDYFEIRTILTEAITNAFKHGNKCNEKMPIYIHTRLDGHCFEMEIADTGKNKDTISIPKSISEDNVMDSGGRGLFLIQSMADMVVFENNILVIRKRLTV